MSGTISDLTQWIKDVPAPWWLLMLGVGVLLMALSSSRAPVVKTREGGRAPGGRRVLWRFATGAHLDGQTRTDAGWWSRGRADMTTIKKAPRWSFLPRGVRALIRLGVLGLAVLFTWGYTAGGAPLVAAWLAVGTLAVVAAAFAPTRIRRARHRRRYVLPIHKALRRLVGHEDKTRPEDWITLPRHFARTGAVIRLELPAAFPDSPQLRQGINNAVVNNCGLSLHELDIAYEVTAQSPHVTFTSVDAADRYLRPVRADAETDTGSGRRDVV